MPDLDFKIESVAQEPFAAAPLLLFKLRVSDASVSAPQSIHSIVLRCQIRIEATRRRYAPNEQERLKDLFDEPSRWGKTLRSMLWAHANVVVPGFIGATVVDMPVPCTFDFNVAAAKYFDALEDGQVPLCFLFSGTIFHAGDDGLLQVAQISWEKEANFSLPVRAWKEMMDLYYPNTAWLCLRKDVFDRLHKYKVLRGIPTWEQAFERILDEAQARGNEIEVRTDTSVDLMPGKAP